MREGFYKKFGFFHVVASDFKLPEPVFALSATELAVLGTIRVGSTGDLNQV